MATAIEGRRTRDQVQALAELGFSQAETARELGVSRQRVHQLVHGYSTLNNRGLSETIHVAQRGRCRACGRAIPFEHGEAHHLIAVTNGGHHCPKNIVFVCRPCHCGIHRGVTAANGWLLSPLSREWPKPAPEHNCCARSLEHLREMYLAIHPRAQGKILLGDGKGT